MFISSLATPNRALDTFDAVLNGHFLYFYMVTNYLKPTALFAVVWSVIVSLSGRVYQICLLTL